jgi:hypothetical protein
MPDYFPNLFFEFSVTFEEQFKKEFKSAVSETTRT